jgi:hypothetical protein
MKPYIVLTCNVNKPQVKPVYIFVDAIQTVCEYEDGSRIGVTNGGWQVKETPEEVMAKIREACDNFDNETQ